MSWIAHLAQVFGLHYVEGNLEKKRYLRCLDIT